MDYFDRFLIGAMLSMAAVAYYIVPSDVVLRLWVFPRAMFDVVSAAFAATYKQNPARAGLIFERATRYTALVLFVPLLLLIPLAPEALGLWLDPSFAIQSTSVLRILLLGSFINCLAWTPSVLLVAAHRPDLPAKFHLAEAPPYLALLWWVLPRYGITGAAVAWTARVAVDTTLLFLTARHVLPSTATTVAFVSKMVAAAAVVFGLSLLPAGPIVKILFLLAALGGFALLGWTVLLDNVERTVIWSYLRGKGIAAAGND